MSKFRQSKLEQYFKLQAIAAGVEPPEEEYRFHPTRRWRFDFAWPAQMLAVEIQGGTFSAGRHTRGAGYQGDCDKLNAAQILGWSVLLGTSQTVHNGNLLDDVKTFLNKGLEKS